MLVPRIRQHAGFVLAKDLITMAGHEIIKPVSNRPRDNFSEAGKTPNAANLLCEQKECIRLCQQSFVGLSLIEDDVDSVEILIVEAVPLEQLGRELALQR